jgi:hypothetical protein
VAEFHYLHHDPRVSHAPIPSKWRNVFAPQPTLRESGSCCFPFSTLIVILARSHPFPAVPIHHRQRSLRACWTFLALDHPHSLPSTGCTNACLTDSGKIAGRLPNAGRRRNEVAMQRALQGSGPGKQAERRIELSCSFAACRRSSLWGAEIVAIRITRRYKKAQHY